MGTRLVHHILAVVAAQDSVCGGGSPVFRLPDAEERERVANLLARILQAMVHGLGNGIYITGKALTGGPMKVFYYGRGGTQLPLVAAGLHLGLLTGKPLPGPGELESLPGFSRSGPRDLGRVQPVGRARLGAQVLVFSGRTMAPHLLRALIGAVHVFGREDVVLGDTGGWHELAAPCGRSGLLAPAPAQAAVAGGSRRSTGSLHPGRPG